MCDSHTEKSAYLRFHLVAVDFWKSLSSECKNALRTSSRSWSALTLIPAHQTYTISDQDTVIIKPVCWEAHFWSHCRIRWSSRTRETREVWWSTKSEALLFWNGFWHSLGFRCGRINWVIDAEPKWHDALHVHTQEISEKVTNNNVNEWMECNSYRT